jgi:hypothetical protein
MAAELQAQAKACGYQSLLLEAHITGKPVPPKAK